MKNVSIFFVFLSLLTSLSCNNKLLTEKKAAKPNIIVILIDDAGYADFGFMGSRDLQTPEIDKLAASGTIFTDAHVSSTVCSPSRAGIISGRYQQRFGFECNGTGDNSGLDPSEITIGQALKNNNYKTIAIGKWHLGEDKQYLPNNRGFDEFYGFIAGSRQYFYKPDEDDKAGSTKALMHNNTQIKFDGYMTDVLGDAAVDYIGQKSQQPFFMYLSFNAVHTPMQAKPEDLEKFKDHPRKMLAAMTWSLDQNVGKVIRKLEEEKLLENTLIFFLSDNGGAHNNQSSVYPLKGWKGNDFEGGHRVPFVVSWKGRLPSGSKNHQLTSALDIYATSLAASGAKAVKEKPLDGVNLIPFIMEKRDAEPHGSLFWRKDKDAAARVGDYKLIRLDNFGSVLYDVEKNIGETQDLTSSEKSRSDQLHVELREWEKGMIKPLWDEGPAWTQVTYDIHKALMKNEQPKRKQP
jgi:arylsulfatase A-like enzyme